MNSSAEPSGPRQLFGRIAGRMTERVVETVQPDVILEHVDVDALVDRIDINRLLERVDPNVILDRIDVERLVGRIDINRILASIDVDALLDQVDLEAAVRRSGVPEIVAESTSRVAGSALDVARRQIAGLDAVLDRVVGTLMRRDASEAGEPVALGPTPETGRSGRVTISGHYAGSVSRAAAAALDVAIIFGLYTLGYAGLDLLTKAFLGLSLDGVPQPYAGLAFVLWAFAYLFATLAVAGRSLGKAIIGLRVVRATGETVRVRQAFGRVCALSLSAILLGVGFVLIVLRADHRALHDLIAKTAVVYDWGDRPAELPGPLSQFLARASSSHATTGPDS